MQWQPTADQEDFRTALRGWLGQHAGSAMARRWASGVDAGDFDTRFAAEGWFGVGAPEELGGEGGGPVELAIVAEELGRAAAPSGLWLGAILALPALVGAPERAKAQFSVGAVVVLGVEAGRVPAAGDVRVEDGRITGTIPTVLGATRARYAAVPIGSGDDAEVRLVELGDEGARVEPRRLLDGTRDAGDLVLDGAVGLALEADVIAAGRDRAALLTAADALGAAGRMLDLAVEYAGQRKQFGVPIGSFQAVKHAAAEMLVAVEAARSIVYDAAIRLELGLPEAGLHAAAAKAQVTAAAARVADSALTLHGAIGYTYEHDLQLFYKRAKLDQALFGAPAEWNERIADVLGLVPVEGRGV
jgi:alkylation response protein AidB-like acyl-CoA dehydrogenase